MRSGFVALAGRPNVGKSTLVNRICGGKVAIVSDKPQTTRHRIRGVVNGDGYQLVLVDLPGFQRPRDALTERMQRRVDESLEDVDGGPVRPRRRRGDRSRRPLRRGADLLRALSVIIVLNKVDRVRPARIAEQIERASALGDFRALHPVSAVTGDGVGALREELASILPEGVAYFPPGELMDLPLELRVAELVREKALALTREEVPHSITVEVEELTARRVTASVLVETESQKQIVVGKGGSMIREIGTRARPEIELLLGRPVYLDLRVKAKPKWRRDERLLERLGI